MILTALQNDPRPAPDRNRVDTLYICLLSDLLCSFSAPALSFSLLSDLSALNLSLPCFLYLDISTLSVCSDLALCIYMYLLSMSWSTLSLSLYLSAMTRLGFYLSAMVVLD